MAKVGRPTVRTKEINRKIEEAAAIGASIEEIAMYCGVWRSTLYRWIKDDQELKDRIEELQERPIMKARQSIVKSLDDPNHAFRYLEKKRKKEFGNTLDITTDGEKVNKITVEIIDGNKHQGDKSVQGDVPSTQESEHKDNSKPGRK